MVTGEHIGAGVLLVVVVGTLWLVRAPHATVDGKVVIRPTNVPALIRHDQEVDAALTITHQLTGDTFKADYFLGNLYWTPETRDSGVWKVDYRHYRYLIDPGFDVGSYAGYCNGFEVGVRVSPVRFLYGTVALDGLIGANGAGVGVSLFPMPEYFGKIWSHVGLGYGREMAYTDDSSSNAFYLALSTRF